VPYRQDIRKIQGGGIGKLLPCANISKASQSDWTDMHLQMQKWYYFKWFSGDFNVEQNVHNLDVFTWTMKDKYPVKAIGMGVREVRKGPAYCNIFDYQSVVYEYEDGAHLVNNTRQMKGCESDICVNILGEIDSAILTERTNGVRTSGANKWSFAGEAKNLCRVENSEIFARIRAVIHSIMASTWQKAFCL